MVTLGILTTDKLRKPLPWAGIALFQFTLSMLHLTLGWQFSFAVLLFVIIAAIFVKRPEWGLYILIFLVVVFWNIIGFSYSDLNLLSKKMPAYAPFVLLGLFCMGIRILSRIQRPVNHGSYFTIPIFGLYIYSLYTLTWYTDPIYSFFTFAYFTFNILLFYYSCFIDYTEKIYNTCMWCWVVTGIIMAVMIIISIIYHPQYEYTKTILGSITFNFRYIVGVGTRGYAFMHSNYTSYTLNAPIAIAIGLLITVKKRCQKMFLLFILVLMIFANCLTFSKGGVGSMIIMIYFIIAASSGLRKRLFFLIPTFTSVFFFLRLSSMFFGAIFGQVVHAKILDSRVKSISIGDRLETWSHGFNLLMQKESFFQGLGLGGFDQYTQKLLHPHNMYLSLFFDFGIVGIAFGIVALIIIARVVLKNGLSSFLNQQTDYQTMRIIFTAIIIAYMVHSLVDHWYNQTFIWFFMGFAMVTFNLANREQMNHSGCLQPVSIGKP